MISENLLAESGQLAYRLFPPHRLRSLIVAASRRQQIVVPSAETRPKDAPNSASHSIQPMTKFSDDLLQALGAWQNGWGEVQERRESLAAEMVLQVAKLPDEFRHVTGPCYRKRFIHKGEMVALFLEDSRDEGVASWTQDLRFAEQMKGLTRTNAVSGAIFEHFPSQSEVIVSYPALWASEDFRNAVDCYSSRGGHHAKALLNFRDNQSEVVLQTPLRSSAMIALTGASSPFDDLCDMVSLPEDQRSAVFQSLIESGKYPGEVQYIDREATQRVVTRSIERLYHIVRAHLVEQGIVVAQ